ncbi:hypothetical protein EEL33_05760 [Muribaculaceae bacterium Isolate-037 (Harlan)]|nr:hypothetical protein EEL33_05760 [Muribaculaceae bacterium Isolate-037 (Harlan)]
MQKDILGYLQRGEAVPQEYRSHMLSGDYKGHMECHVWWPFRTFLNDYKRAGQMYIS